MAADAPAEAAPQYTAWLNLGEGVWVRAFDTRDVAEAFSRLPGAMYNAGAKKGRLLPSGVHPADTPEPPQRRPLPAHEVVEFGPDGPIVRRRRAVGWLLIGGTWERVAEDEDIRLCVQRTQALALERGGPWMKWKVLPEGADPAEDGGESNR